MKGDISPKTHEGVCKQRSTKRTKLPVVIALLAVTTILLLCTSQASAFVVQTVSPSDSSGTTQLTFTNNQNVYSTVTYTGTGTKTLDIYITTSVPANNGDLRVISAAVPTTVVYSATALTKVAWSAPTTPGTYYIVLDEDRNGNYNPSRGEEYSTPFTVNPAMVAPEYTWGGLAALSICFIAFAIFIKRGNLALTRKSFSQTV